MAPDLTDDRTRSVREAMDRVLAAEKEAQRQIEVCRNEIEGMMAEVRERELRILDNTERRINRVHAASQRATAGQIREMRRESAGKMAHIDYKPGGSEAISRASAELARRLTSGSSSD